MIKTRKIVTLTVLILLFVISISPVSACWIKNNAESYRGVPYEWGGEDFTGIDCSGLVHRSFIEAGVNLPDDTAHGYSNRADNVEKTNIGQGDLIFFDWDADGDVDHVGIYEGGNRMIHASSSKGKVVEQDLTGRGH